CSAGSVSSRRSEYIILSTPAALAKANRSSISGSPGIAVVGGDSTVVPPMRRCLRPTFWKRVMSGLLVALKKWDPALSGSSALIPKLNPMKSAGMTAPGDRASIVKVTGDWAGAVPAQRAAAQINVGISFILFNRAGAQRKKVGVLEDEMKPDRFADQCGQVVAAFPTGDGVEFIAEKCIHRGEGKAGKGVSILVLNFNLDGSGG